MRPNLKECRNDLALMINPLYLTEQTYFLRGGVKIIIQKLVDSLGETFKKEYLLVKRHTRNKLNAILLLF